MGLLMISGSIFSSSAEARQWTRIPIPGAKCGNGSEYAVYKSPGASDKLVVFFQGGGACWDYNSCYGAIPMTRTKVKKLEGTEPFFSDNPARSPVSDHSVLYFPYCTGDVYIGQHTATYKFGTLKKKMNHWGNTNFFLTMQHLSQEGIIDFPAVREAIVYGFSAGAVGAFIHLQDLTPYFLNAVRRTAILDAPGLHWSKNFWKKYSKQLINDFEKGFAHVGIPFNQKDGNLAQYMGKYCAERSEWMIGVLQGSQDIVMSLLFSGQPPANLEKTVYGPTGIYRTTENPLDNCSAWVPRTIQHTFLPFEFSSHIRAGSVSAREYVSDLIHGFGSVNHRD